MKLTLTVYTDETLQEVKRVIEAEELKIPYRVAMYVAEELGKLDEKNTDSLFSLVVGSADKVTKIIKATFGVSETELDCIDMMELGNVAKEIYKWALDKFASLKGNNEKNA